MNTYTNTMHPKKEGHRTARNTPFNNAAIMTVILTLVAVAAIAAYASSRPVAAAENNPVVAYGNALELQYARPWLEQNRPLVAYGNALELQYAQPWLEAQNKPAVVYSNALEFQYAQPWLAAQQQINCSSSIEMLYACKYGFGLP